LYEEGWKPTKTIAKVIQMFKDILVKPITEAPLEILIAEEYANNPKEFK